MREIIAGIVTYNPDVGTLKTNILALMSQVKELCIVDNASADVAKLEILLDEDLAGYNIHLIKNDGNKGIATGLNQLIEYAHSTGYEWILTMDQDSTALPGMMDEYCRYLEYPDVAMITPCVLQSELDNSTGDMEYIDKCITSGCLTSVAAMQNIGGFDDNLFIDYVDFDACVRLTKAGYRILRVNKILIRHKVGNATPLKLFGRNIYIRGNLVEIYHEPVIRTYYLFRNLVIFMRKHGKDSRGFTSVPHIIWRAFLVVACEKPKWPKIKAIVTGISDGITYAL